VIRDSPFSRLFVRFESLTNRCWTTLQVIERELNGFKGYEHIGRLVFLTANVNSAPLLMRLMLERMGCPQRMVASSPCCRAFITNWGRRKSVRYSWQRMEPRTGALTRNSWRLLICACAWGSRAEYKVMTNTPRTNTTSILARLWAANWPL